MKIAHVAPVTAYEAFIRDPDGNLIELVAE